MILTQDRAGNQVYIKDKYVYLHLKEKMETRKLGVINLGNLFVTRKPEHLFRKFNAYGFNMALIKALNPDAKVVVRQYGDKVLTTTAEEILQKGKVLNYAKDGFETQIFMPLDNFKHN